MIKIIHISMQRIGSEWYQSLPIITKVYSTICFLTVLAVYLDIISFLDIYLNFDLIWNKLELWRLVTNFFFFGEFGIGFIFHMSFFIRHCRILEEGIFRGRTADYFFMLIFGASLMLFIGFIFHHFRLSPHILIFGPSLTLMIVYVWARYNTHMRLNFLGLFTITAPYLPWAFVILDLIISPNLMSILLDVIGIFVGHIYYHLVYVYPEITGRYLLKTPRIIKAIFDEHVE